MSLVHSQVPDICNIILDMEGFAVIDAANYNERTALQRPQIQVRHFVNVCDAELFVRLNTIFTERRFTINTSADVASYPVEDITDIENIRYHSMRCIKDGTLERMIFLDYINEFRPRYPDPYDMPTGKPIYWTYQITAGGQTNLANQIIFAPTPDDAYEFEYWAKVNHKKLELPTDQILWTPQYEHVLINWGREMFATRDGQPMQQLSSYAQQAIESVKMWSIKPPDKKLRANFGGLVISDGIGVDSQHHWRW